MAGVLVTEENDTRIFRREHDISLDIPEGLELSEEEMRKAISLTQNEIIDIVSGERAKILVTIARPVVRPRQKKNYRELYYI